MFATRYLCAAALISATLIFPAAASACRPSEPSSIFWDAPPKAEDGEVVLRVRSVRIEPQPGHSEITSLCGAPYAPKVSVFEVIEIAEGDFEPRYFTLLGAFAPGATGWLAGKPRTLDYSGFAKTYPGEPPLPEPATLQWRAPCVDPAACRVSPANIFKP